MAGRESQVLQEPKQASPPAEPETTGPRKALQSLTVKELRAQAKELSVDLAGRRLKKEIIEALLSAQGVAQASDIPTALTTAEEVERGLERMQVLWVGTINHLKEGDYKSTLSLSKEGLDLLSGLGSDYREEMCGRALQAAEAFSHRYGDSKHARQLKSKLKNARAALEAGHLDKCSDLIGDLEREVSDLYLEEMSRLGELLHDKEEDLEELAAINADPALAHELLSNADAAFKIDDNARALHYIHKFEAVVKEARESREESVLHYLAVVEAKLKETEGLGGTLAESRKLLKEAHKALEEGNLAMASDLAQRCERSIIEAQRHHLEKAMELREKHYQEVREVMAYLRPLLEEARSYGIDIEDAKEFAQEALDHLRQEEYYLAVEKSRAAKRFFDSLQPLVAAEREKRGIFKPTGGECNQCGSAQLDYSDDGWAVCNTCGHRFTWSLKPEPWFVSFLKRRLGG